MLKLLQKSDNTFKEIKEIQIPDTKKVQIEFSPDGVYMAMLLRKENILKIYHIQGGIDGLEYLLENIECGEEPMLEFNNNESLFKTKQLEWDVRSKYLVCFGVERLNVISLESQEAEILFKFELDRETFKEIMDV